MSRCSLSIRLDQNPAYLCFKGSGFRTGIVGHKPRVLKYKNPVQIQAHDLYLHLIVADF